MSRETIQYAHPPHEAGQAVLLSLNCVSTPIFIGGRRNS